MRTVKEVSNITCISVRTLHYYDEIRLFFKSPLNCPYPRCRNYS